MVLQFGELLHGSGNIFNCFGRCFVEGDYDRLAEILADHPAVSTEQTIFIRKAIVPVEDNFQFR